MRISRQQTSAIIFSILLILSATTVGIAFPASTPSKDVPASSSQIDSLSQREAAFSALQDATVKGKPGQKEELLTALNRTFAAYVGPNRVDDSVFAADRRIVTRTQRDAPGVAEEIADADERLARTALADAEAAHDELSADSNVTYDEASVEWELSRARTALANGGDTPVARVQRYRRAWQHAQAALDTMDRAVTPRVSITTRADPRHAESITYRLNGTVTDVRTFEIRTVTVTVADGTAKTVELKRGPAPFATGTFDTTLTLDKPVNEITVDATDENAHLGARERGAKGNRGNGNDGAGSDEERPPSTGSDTLLLDADGLPDGYERSVVGTSPLDTDSDAPTTNVSEADDGIVDGAEDFDGDRVTTVVEYRAGTDPFDVDTDDDDLTDWFELSYERLDPLAGDTDGDGVPDGQDDTEPDGLTNVREQRHGTNPNVVDTDGDRLTDAYEVDTTLTVPTVADSDSARTGTNESGDGVSDGAEDFENDTLATASEGNISTDPFDPDTDDDRLRDAFEHAYDTIDPTTNDTDGDGALDTWEDPDGETLVNLHEQSNGTVPTDADTDDDLLTDAYEVGTTRTDPTDVDSDSTRTNRSEADDSVRDGAEDFDGDALATRIEQNVSTDPFDADTDDDTLTDLFEHRFATVDPLRRDTDGDGVADGREDPDDEGLVNVGEQRYGTLPLDPDTDADNLTDYYEVDTTKTNPLVPDSDSGGTVPDEAGDGVVDGSEDFDGDALANAMEFTAGTDPFDPDTDDDGLRDGFEQAYDTLSPLTNDTDGDGTLDAVEDPDGDGLVNVDEQAAGTSPVDPDTDGDTLTDAFEVERSLTSPLAVDSDSAGTNASEGEDGITDDAEDLENDSLTNAREQELDTDPLLADTDGDGLTDAYEVRTTRTDPLSNVSDSAVTNADESTNDVPDGLEDFDADQVESHYEEVFGTDPFDDDTDGDGVTDGFEVHFSVLDPLSEDSDGDGVGDAREDGDGDGLDTAAEERAGTDPTATDTDFDTLNDSVELAEHGTDPRSPDTDDDGLRDDEELDLGTDPLVGDSDGDGVPDGEETFTTTATNESVGASVAITGQGNVAESVTVRNSTDAMVTSDAVASVAASKPLDFTAGREFDEATLTLSYDESKVSDESDLAVFRWKPDAQTFEEVPSTVDAANDTVSATTPHFSIYIVFDGQWYPTQFSTGDDSGGSGDSGSGGSGDDQERRIIDGGFSDLDDWTAIGDVSTDGTDAVVESDAPSDDDGGSGGDDGDDGDDGGDGDDDDDDDDGDDDGDDSDDDDDDRCYTGGCIVSLSGSVATSSSSGTTSTLERDVTFEDDAVDATVSVTVEGDATADRTSDAAAVVETAGGDRELFELDSGTSGTVTREVDLSKVGGDTVTVRFTASNGATLRVSDVTVSATHDSDGDGLTNARETGGFTLGTGETIYTNPYAADTDGDGLSDGREIDGPAENDYGTYTRLDSDPTELDSDGDGLYDGEEHHAWGTDPLKSDSDEDGFSDYVDPDNGADSYPPRVEHFRSQNFKDYVRFRVEDGSEVTVSARAYFDPATPTHESYWSDSKATVEQLSENEYKVSLSDHGDAAEPPSKYWINVTDSNGNSRAFLLSVQRGAPAYITRAGVFVTGVAAIPKTDPVPEEIAGLLVLPITFAVYGGVNAYIPADGTVYRAPISGTERIYEGTVIGKVALASGFTETATVNGEIVRRGRGWEHLAATTSLTQTEIEQVLQSYNSVVDQRGQYTLVIGDNPSSSQKVVLYLLESVLVHAISYDDVVEDPLGREVFIDEDDVHPIREEKNTDYDEIKETIRNPDEIWRGSEVDYYVRQLEDGGWQIVKVYTGIKQVRHISTTIARNTEAGVREYLNNDVFDNLHRVH